MSDTRANNGSRTLASAVVAVAYLLVALAIAYAVATTFELRTGNPYEISNAHNELSGWHPENNFVQVVAFVLLIPIVWWGLLALDRSHPRIARAVVVVFCAGVSFATLVLPASQFVSYDQFHWGEQLAPSLAFTEGAVPYTDIYVLHGMGEDVWRPIIGFLLFSGGEPNIGAYVLVSAIGRGLASIAFYAMLAVVVRSRPVFLVAAIWFATTSFTGLSSTRNLFVFVGFALVFVAFNRLRTARSRTVALACFGALSSLTVFYSIDVGLLMIGLAVGLAFAAPFFDWGDDGSVAIERPSASPRRFAPTIALLASAVGVQLLFVLLLRPSAYRDFLTMTFVEIPRYQGLTWDYPIPDMDEQQWVRWLIYGLLGVSLFGIGLLVRASWREGRRFGGRLVCAAVFGVGALVYLRFGVGRPDTDHFLVSTVLVLVVAFIMVELVLERFPVNTSTGAVAAITMTVALAQPFTVSPPWQWFVNGRVALTAAYSTVTLPRLSDDAWIPADRRELIDFIRDNTNAGDSLYVVESEPMYYYFTGLRNPTRFAISWFTDPAPYSREVVLALESDPPKYIVMSPDSPWATTDSDIPIADRVPEVVRWIEDRYPNVLEFGDFMVRSR